VPKPRAANALRLIAARFRKRNFDDPSALSGRQPNNVENVMGFGRGLLLWLLGIPLPIIILLAIFMHH
jgi:hypothetical protein